MTNSSVIMFKNFVDLNKNTSFVNHEKSRVKRLKKNTRIENECTIYSYTKLENFVNVNYAF